MIGFLTVMLGGAIGAGSRYAMSSAMLARFGPGFPWGTLSINLLGGLLMGLLAGGLSRVGGHEGARLLLGVGVLGGFTTFSAFSLDTVVLIDQGRIVVATAYILASVTGSVLLTLLGLTLARPA